METAQRSWLEVFEKSPRESKLALLGALGAAHAHLSLNDPGMCSTLASSPFAGWSLRGGHRESAALSTRAACDPENLCLARKSDEVPPLSHDAYVAFLVLSALALLPDEPTAAAMAFFRGYCTVRPHTPIELPGLPTDVRDELLAASGRHRLPKSKGFVPPPLPHLQPRLLSPAQETLSRAVIAALGALPDTALHPIVALRRQSSAAGSSAESPAASHMPVGPLTSGENPWTRAGNGPPHVFDFTAANVALRELTGAGDAARLDAFCAATFAPLISGPAAAHAPTRLLDDPAEVDELAAAWEVPRPGAVSRIGWGRYGEDRVIYDSAHFAPPAGDPVTAAAESPAAAARTIHLGVDLFVPAGTPVYAPMRGTVHSVGVNVAPLDYGPTLVLRHELPSSLPSPSSPGSESLPVECFTLYGHLSLASLVRPDASRRLRPGDAVPAGGLLGWVGPRTANGGWPPHVHFQVCSEARLGSWRGDYPGVCSPADWAAFSLLCPDPILVLRCAAAPTPAHARG